VSIRRTRCINTTTPRHPLTRCTDPTTSRHHLTRWTDTPLIPLSHVSTADADKDNRGEVDAGPPPPPPTVTLSLKETQSVFSAIAPEWHRIKNSPEAQRFYLAAAEAMATYWSDMRVYADTIGCDECTLRATDPKYLERIVAQQLQVMMAKTQRALSHT
jgi:hypothetical protein